MEEREFLVNDYFTDSELGMVLMGLHYLADNNPYITEEQYETINCAINKLTKYI